MSYIFKKVYSYKKSILNALILKPDTDNATCTADEPIIDPQDEVEEQPAPRGLHDDPHSYEWLDGI